MTKKSFVTSATALSSANTYFTFQLTLPKFKLEESLELHKIFPNMGVEDVFQPGKADLSGISTSAPDLHIDQVMHKAVLEVSFAPKMH